MNLEVRAVYAAPPPFHCMVDKEHSDLPFLYETKFFGKEGPAVFPIRLCTRCMKYLVQRVGEIQTEAIQGAAEEPIGPIGLPIGRIWRGDA